MLRCPSRLLHLARAIRRTCRTSSHGTVENLNGAFHVFLEPSGIGPGAVVLALDLYLAWAYRNSYRHMLALRAKPS